MTATKPPADATIDDKGDSMKCRTCGKTATESGGWLERVNEKGVTGIWECRPACDATLSLTDKMLGAIAAPDAGTAPTACIFCKHVEPHTRSVTVRDGIAFGCTAEGCGCGCAESLDPAPTAKEPK